jgi:hypothetical protein
MKRVPWLAFSLLGTALALFAGARILGAWHLGLPPCPMKTITGIPCPACGLTRCVMALAQGRWTEAFHWHPVTVILGLLSPVAITWDLRRSWKGDVYPSLPDSLVLRLSVAGLLVGTWVLQIVRGI